MSVPGRRSLSVPTASSRLLACYQRIFEFTPGTLPGQRVEQLMTVLGIVRQSGGRIDVTSEPGAGSTFSCFLPVTHLERPASAAALVEGPVRPGSETVLVVEDQPDVRELIGHTLRRYGYTVIEAGGADEAIETCRNHPGPIELLVSDVVMPGLGGPAMAERIASFRPAVRVLFISGYAEEMLTRKGSAIQAVAFLEKPFTSQALARRVRAVLDGEPE